MHVCVVVVCEYMCGGVCICVSAIRTVDTNLQVYGHVLVTTRVNAHKHLTITHFLYMFTADKLMLQLHTSIYGWHTPRFMYDLLF